MRWILYAVAAIAIVLAVVAAIGAMLPRQHRASRTVRLALPPDALYRLLTAIKFGDTPVRIEREDPPSLLVTRVVEGQPFGGTWTYQVVAAPGGSELTITEDGEVYNVIFRALSRFVFGHHATLDAYLKHLERRLEDEKK